MIAVAAESCIFSFSNILSSSGWWWASDRLGKKRLGMDGFVVGVVSPREDV